MGHYRAPNGTMSYEPDDGENYFYLIQGCGWSISDIIDEARKRWGVSLSLDDIKIEGEDIHTDCLGYDCYDSSDWTMYLCITRINTLNT